MGPRSIDRGITSAQPVICRSSLLQWGRDQLIAEFHCLMQLRFRFYQLQWGRDQLIAELGQTRTRPDGTSRLQWGRDQLIAEFLDRKDNVYPRKEASMGPRSIDRGILVRSPAAFSARSLQWGRDQLIAELWSALAGKEGKFPLQWGRDQLIAELKRVRRHVRSIS